jgi:hypothetical protein
MSKKIQLRPNRKQRFRLTARNSRRVANSIALASYWRRVGYLKRTVRLFFKALATQ